MTYQTDVILIHPGDKRSVYQDLGESFSAIEPPVWCAIIAFQLRAEGFSVKIIDANAENLSPTEVSLKIHDISPALVGVLVTGVHPSASTQSMPSALKICQAITSACDVPVALAGLHPTVLPQQTLEDSTAKFVIEGNSLFSFVKLLNYLKDPSIDIYTIPGLWFYISKNKIQFTFKSPIISEIPETAWDLLPMSMYRAHNWQCLSNISSRNPYASIYTSIGCPYQCKFCCVHAFWQTHQVKYRSSDAVIAEIDFLVNKYRIKYLKIADENFLLNEDHYLPILKKLIHRQYNLNIWCYARIDTLKKKYLKMLRQAGFNWIALGIESSDSQILNAVAKPISKDQIIETVKAIQDEGLSVMGNFVFGLPDDHLESLQATFVFAQRLSCEFVNFNCMMPYPGTIYYKKAIESGTAPPSWAAYSQHAYESQPLPTNYLSASQILEFRDQAFNTYFSNPCYLKKIENKFGLAAKKHIENMTRKKLQRKLLM